MLISDEDRALGHPSLRPEFEVCYVSRSEEMDAEEERLRHALLAVAPGCHQGISPTALSRAISEIPDAYDANLAVRRFAPESFLIVFPTQRSRDAAMRAGSVSVGGVRFLFRPWTRLVRAEAGTLRYRVSLEIEGIPAHAWGWRVARKLLASSCWIEYLDASSEDLSDMTALKATVWTDDPRRIPLRKLLVIAEHELPIVHGDPSVARIFANVRPYLRQKKVLKYETTIHQRSIADFNSRSPSLSPDRSPPSSDGDSGHDGNPTSYSCSGQQTTRPKKLSGKGSCQVGTRGVGRFRIRITPTLRQPACATAGTPGHTGEDHQHVSTEGSQRRGTTCGRCRPAERGQLIARPQCRLRGRGACPNSSGPKSKARRPQGRAAPCKRARTQPGEDGHG